MWMILGRFIKSEPCGEISGSSFIITGSGEVDQYFVKNSGNYQLYTDVAISGDVTSIGSYAFMQCSSLTIMKLLSKVQSISSDAFRLCTKLKAFNVDPGNIFFRTDIQNLLLSYNLTVLYFCPAALTSLTIPTSVRYIQGYCMDSTRAKSIHIPWSVVSMGKWFSVDCSLGLLTFDQNITIESLGDVFVWSKLTKIEIPASVKVLKSTFANSRVLKIITFAKGSKLQRIGTETFANCPVERIELPEGFTEFESKALASMSNLNYVKIPSTVEIMPSDVFSSTTTVSTVVCDGNPRFTVIDNVLYDTNKTTMFLCTTSATSVEITMEMTNISTTLFQGCNKLKTLIVSKDHPSYCGINGVLYTKDCTKALSVIGGIPNASIIEGCKVIDVSCCVGCKIMKSIELNEGLEKICDYGFSRCGLTSIHIPSTVTHIYKEAFNSAEDLTTITFGKDSKLTFFCYNVFYKSGITSIKIPKNLGSLSNRLFYTSHSLSSIEFEEGANLNTIEKECFHKTSIRKIEFKSNLKYIQYRAFNDNPYLSEVTFPSDCKLEQIAEGAFLDCNITRLELPPLLSILQTTAFKNNKFLEEVIFKGNVITELPQSIFENDFLLNKITLPNTLKSINPLTFTNCKIEEIKFNDEVQSNFVVDNNLIYSKDKKILYYCPGGIKKAKLAEGLEVIELNAFYYSISLINLTFPEICSVGEISTKGFFMCTSLSKLILPDSIGVIRHFGFYGCSSLEYVIFGKDSSLTNIEESGFEGCSSLKEIILPNKLFQMGTKSFSNCISLKSVEFEKDCKLKIIEKETFNGCKLLKSFEFPEGIETINSGIFEGCESLEQIKFKKGQLKKIDKRAFENKNIKTIEFEDGIEVDEIGDYAFTNTEIENIEMCKVKKYGKGVFLGCTKLRCFKFGEDVVNISDNMFEGCIELSMNISKMNLEIVGIEGFKGCKKIIMESTPSTLQTIKRRSFESIGMNGNLKIGDSVKIMEEGCFVGNYFSEVLFCGNKDIGESGKKIFEDKTVVFVPFRYMNNMFCGSNINHILDGDCYKPSVEFTAGCSNKSLLEVISPLFIDNSDSSRYEKRDNDM